MVSLDPASRSDSDADFALFECVTTHKSKSEVLSENREEVFSSERTALNLVTEETTAKGLKGPKPS
jgi:hypothetical protein